MHNYKLSCLFNHTNINVVSNVCKLVSVIQNSNENKVLSFSLLKGDNFTFIVHSWILHRANLWYIKQILKKLIQYMGFARWMKVVPLNRSWDNIWSKFGVQLPLTITSPRVKGNCPFRSNTGCIRCVVLVFRNVNLTGLKARHVGRPKTIWTKFDVWLPRTICGLPSWEKILSYLFAILIRWPRGGGVSNCNLKFWILSSETRKHEWKWSRGI